MPLLQAVPNLSHEKCVRCWHFCIFEMFCELLEPFEKVSQSVSRCSITPLCFYFGCLVNRCSFLVPDRHFALLLDLKDVLDESCGGDVQDELVPEFDENPGTTRRTKLSVLQRIFFWSGVAFDRWPNHGNVHVLRRAFRVIELQACPRESARLRRDQQRKHIPVLPRVFAILHWPLPPLWGPGSLCCLQFF